MMVPSARLELAQLSPLPPQDSVSTNFTTTACKSQLLGSHEEPPLTGLSLAKQSSDFSLKNAATQLHQAFDPIIWRESDPRLGQVL